MIASCSKSVHRELCIADIKVIAAGWALSFALDVGVKRAVFEGDSLTVIIGLMEEERLLVPLRMPISCLKASMNYFTLIQRRNVTL